MAHLHVSSWAGWVVDLSPCSNFQQRLQVRPTQRCEGLNQEICTRREGELFPIPLLAQRVLLSPSRTRRRLLRPPRERVDVFSVPRRERSECWGDAAARPQGAIVVRGPASPTATELHQRDRLVPFAPSQPPPNVSSVDGEEKHIPSRRRAKRVSSVPLASFASVGGTRPPGRRGGQHCTGTSFHLRVRAA